jgi:hypothetical protein
MNKQLQGSGKTENTIIRDIFGDRRVSLFQRLHKPRQLQAKPMAK